MALLESLDTLGGSEYFVWLGRNHPGAYAQLVGKVIPQEIKAEIDHTVTGVVFKTVYETAPEPAPDALAYNPPTIINAIVEEAITLPTSPSPPEP